MYLSFLLNLIVLTVSWYIIWANELEYTNELIRIVRFQEIALKVIRILSMFAISAQLVVYLASHEHAQIF